MAEEYRNINETRDEAGTILLLRNSEIYQLIIDGLRNETKKPGVNSNNTKKKQIFDTV